MATIVDSTSGVDDLGIVLHPVGRPKRRRARWLVLGAFLTTAVVLGAVSFFDGDESEAEPALAEQVFRQASLDREYDPYGYIAHAMGSASGHTYTNSPEAFRTSYAKGFRIFEVDLVRLADGNVLAAHPGLEEFYGLDRAFGEAALEDIHPYFPERDDAGLSLLTGDGLIRLMASHPDALVVTDTKDDHIEILESLVAEADRRGQGIADRLVPHVRDPSEFEAMQAVHPFPASILALYRSQATNELNDDEVIDFIRTNHIPAVMMWHRARDPELTLAQNTAQNRRMSAEFIDRIRDAGAVVYVHSLNDPEAIELFESRAIGVYSDGFFPDG